jgi:hypothetical protein
MWSRNRMSSYWRSRVLAVAVAAVGLAGARPVSPANGATIRATTVPFRWEACPGAARYHIRVSRRTYPRELKKGDYRPSYFLKDAARFQAAARQAFAVNVE